MSSKTLILSLYLLSVSSVLGDSPEPDYYEYIKEAINLDGIKSQLKASLGDSNEALLVALEMIDASGKIPSGIGKGNFFELGHFDECYGIEYGEIYGKYCLGTLALPPAQSQKFTKMFGQNMTVQRPVIVNPQPRLAGLGTEYMGFHFGVCVPSNWRLSDIPSFVTFSEEMCYSKATEPELSPGAITTIVILSIFLCIIVASTIYDICFYYLEKKPLHELMIAFSFWSNGQKIFKSSNNPDQLLCLNGIKAISMMWVLISHEYSLAVNGAVSNFFEVLGWRQDSANMFIMGATVSVDTFFVVGGLVTVYTFLKSMDKGVKFNIPLYYIHRILRLTPAFGIMILIHMFLLNYLGDGPLWKVVDVTLVESCEKTWWSSLLYISNYLKEGNCVPQTWYLSVDMQLFILSPLVLIPLYRWPKIGLGSLGFLSVLGCVAPFVVAYTMNLGAFMGADPINYMYEYYDQTYTRFGPYVIGMILGYYLYQIKKSSLTIRLKPLMVCGLWLVSLTGLVACLYAGHPLMVATKGDLWGESMFTAFDRPAWAVALSGVIFLCVSGYGGPIDTFLSLPVFQFITKLSYSMYLIHYAVITIRYSSMRNPIKFSNMAIFHSFWGDFMFTLLLSLILCLSFESPIIILEKHLFGRGKPKSVPRKPIV